jgi:hypothetical protein
MILGLEFKKTLSRVRIWMVLLWASCLASTVSLFFIPESTLKKLPVSEYYPYLTQLENVLWVIALACALLVLWAKQRFYNIEAIFQASKRPLLVRPLLASNLKGETPTEKGASRLVYFYRYRIVRALTLSESVAICGLLLALTGSYGLEGRLFYLMSVALLMLFYPSRAFFDSLIEEYEHREIMFELDGRWGRS